MGLGDPDLLSKKARRLLQTAEIVLHEDGLPQVILDLIPAWAQVLNVGKSAVHAGMTQQNIPELLISFARQGHNVLRLKTGDSLVSGRIGEETEALRRAGIDFEIVDAATEALATAARESVEIQFEGAADSASEAPETPEEAPAK